MMAITSSSASREHQPAQGREQILTYLREHSAEILAALSEAQRSGHWLSTNSKVLAAQHPDEWIAVQEAAVIAHDRDLAGLHQELRKLGIEPAAVLIARLEQDPVPLVL